MVFLKLKPHTEFGGGQDMPEVEC